MTFRGAKHAVKNDRAVLSQPVGLLVILIIASVIITLFCLSIQTLTNDSQLHQVEYQLASILTEATIMFEYANQGAIVTIHVEFPRSLRFLVFGALPSNGTSEPTNLTFEEHSSNNYYFVMNDGTTRIYHSNARFSNKNLTQLAIFHAGTYDLILELCSHEGKTYVAMYI